jgi:hypothetical protein
MVGTTNTAVRGINLVVETVSTEATCIRTAPTTRRRTRSTPPTFAGAIVTVNATLATIANYVDTKVASILRAAIVETDNLPATPAAADHDAYGILRLRQEYARAEERKHAAEAKNTEEAQRLDKEMVARNEELRKALEEVRIARVASKAAEEQRLAAVKAAEKAAKTAEQTIAAKRDAERTGDPTKVAALPKLEQPSAGGPFDGIWYLHRLGPGCSPGTQDVRQTIFITNGTVKGQGPLGPITGTVSSTGQLRYSHTSHTGDRQTADGHRLTYQLTLRGKSGSGTFEHIRPGSRCSGTITATRG